LIFDCFDKAKKATKYWWFDVYVYEGQDLWHTRYQLMTVLQELAKFGDNF
jgi:hypothetical protein